MINRQEILDFAREVGLAPQIVEKDYVLGWLLKGISGHPAISSDWIFKGGTCLKKCFFETFRFSEDLDFTVTQSEQLSEQFLLTTFAEIAAQVYEESGIEIPRENLRFDVYKNPRGRPAAEGRISYRGPLQPRGDLPRVKLDLTSDEELVRSSVTREVQHPYSDRPDGGIHARCYCFEEVFAEKLRALADRLRPRDLYDVIHLYRHDEIRPDHSVILEVLEKKCAFKGITVPTAALIQQMPERAELISEWGNTLGHQLPFLPPFDRFWTELPALFDWLHGVADKPIVPRYPITERIDASWTPPRVAKPWGTTAPLEIIRFAAANRLCADLTYGGRRRLIEPYALRRTHEGNLLLKAVKHQTHEDRSYRVDRIQGASATETSFLPKYLVELTPAGPISAPPVQQSKRNSETPSRRSSHQPKLQTSGITYVIGCPVCGKRFKRQQLTCRLNRHKGQTGYKCVGTVGFLVQTRNS